MAQAETDEISMTAPATQAPISMAGPIRDTPGMWIAACTTGRVPMGRDPGSRVDINTRIFLWGDSSHDWNLLI